MPLTQNEKELYKKIDEILWNDWDPIGVNDSAPRDEYQSYTPQIFSIVIKGGDKNSVAQKLYEIETNTIGLAGDFNYCEKIAVKLIEEYEQFINSKSGDRI